MVQRVQVQLIDDLTGQEAQETVGFAVDGIEYEIDLTGQNATDLRAILSGYADKARKVQGERRGGGRRRSSASSAPAEDLSKIRSWAQENGHTASTRGRIARSVVDAYKAAQK